MRTAHEIRQKCEEDIKKLQKFCSHDDTEWIEEVWSFAHPTGRQLNCCQACEKVLEVRDSTWI